MRDGVLDQLDTSVLLTVPAYLASGPGGSAAAPGPPGAGRRDVAAHQEGTWYFAAPLGVTRLEVPDVDARQDAAAGTRIGLLTPGGSARWFPAAAAGPSSLTISLSRPLASVAVVAEAGGHAVRLGPASVTGTGGRVFVADGQLQDALVPPRWGYAGHDGSFAVFVDRFARGALRLQALPGRPASGASVRLAAGPAGSPGAADVSSSRGVRVIRSVSATAGWGATWHPRHGAAAALAVHRDGLVQAVNVPAGRGVVTWSYRPPGFRAGFALSLGAATFIVLLLASGLFLVRSGRPRAFSGDPGRAGRAAAPLIRNSAAEPSVRKIRAAVQPVFRSPAYGEVRRRVQRRAGLAEDGQATAGQGGWDGAGKRHDLVQGSGLPARSGGARLRDLARRRPAGAAPGAVAGDARGVVSGLVPVQRGRGARKHRPSQAARRRRPHRASGRCSRVHGASGLRVAGRSRLLAARDRCRPAGGRSRPAYARACPAGGRSGVLAARGRSRPAGGRSRPAYARARPAGGRSGVLAARGRSRPPWSPPGLAGLPVLRRRSPRP